MSVPKIPNAGEALRSLRQSFGLSLRELADRVGWDKARLSKYENDQLGLSLPVLEEIARALGQRPEVVVLYCLKHRYPSLSVEGSETGDLLDTLVQQMGDSGG